MPELLSVKTDDAEVGRAEALAVLAAAGDPDYRQQLADLVAELDAGELGPETQETLGGVLELALQSGRVRALYGPGGEADALKLYRRLPRGAELARTADEVSC